MISYYNRLPQSVRINKIKYAINTDYRMFIDFEMEMNSIDKKEALTNALYRFYPDIEEIAEKGCIEEAIVQFAWFYRCGIEDDYQEGRTTKHQKKSSQIYNYKYDAQLICGAYAMYGYDLHRYMHWWKFKEIWNSLPAECEYSKIKSYRAYDGKDQDQIELREYYKLPPTEIEIKDMLRREEIFNQLK
jgi:hypothetical protein